MTLSAPPAVIDNEAEKWQEIAERMSDGFVALDRAWRYTYVNSRGAQLLEREAAALIGKHIWTEFPASVDQPFYEACQRVMIDQVPQTIEYQFGPQGRWMETRIFPSAQGVNLFFADRTGRKASQMAIAQTSLRLRAIVDHAALGITQIDARSGAYLFVNKKLCEIVDYDEASMLRSTVAAICAESDRRVAVSQMRLRGTGQAESFTLEIPLRRRDGTFVWTRILLSPMWPLGARPTSYLVLIEDVTTQRNAAAERRRIEEELASARRLESIGRLARGIAHDFNNMLTVINGSAEIARTLLEPNQPASRYLEEIADAGARSAELAQRLLRFSQWQSVAIAPIVPACMNELVQSSLSMLRPLLGERIGLSFVPGKDLWRVGMHAVEMDRILSNLAVNARDAIDALGSVTIETRNVTFAKEHSLPFGKLIAGDYAMLSFTDTGRGMSPSTVSRVFEPFFTTKPTGTGLGLPTVYGIIEQHHGAVRVSSRPGEGTEFIVYLPRYQAVGRRHSRARPTWPESDLLGPVGEHGN